ncbi:BMP family ABC transporter substrate-binding protein [Clostridium sp. D2Q-14]|uniref:BMP family ABC transporter substrate-binding protein n=1 Tax=Anaeromonas gelatinilytica TaxID=2683194 RepID=UPI00193C71A4|nr:BMP family ABC transporter substrate-binding protein [Anaeromonas gelatinilytica]MBS4536768.1 BMP family ABC transporter substrate-binding protein [Anaeromonas gelatinilytica]
MKKTALFVTVILILSLVLGACSGDDTSGEDSKDELKVALLIPGTLGDKSFFDSANAGLELVKKELGAKTKVIEMGTDSTKWEPTFVDVSEGDWDIIISGNDTTELMNEIAKEYPDKRYINFDTFIEETPDNVYSMFYSTNEVSYLAGALASLVTTSEMELANSENTIGFLGGADTPGINDFLVGYIEGAQYVDPEIKVLVSYAGNFTDPAKGKELGIVQYNSGVDISFNVAGGTGLGLMDAANEEDAYAIGVDSDQAMLFKDSDPEKAERIVSSAVKRIDIAIFNAVEKHIAGELEYGTHNEMGVAEEAVELAKNEYYEELPQEIKDRIKEIEEKIKSGEITVGTAFGISTEKIEELRESVRP